MRAFLLRFEETIGNGFEVAPQRATASNSGPADGSIAVVAAGTRTLTEVRNESSRDRDRATHAMLAFPR